MASSAVTLQSTNAAARRRGSSIPRWTAWQVFAVVVIACLARGTSSFSYDANLYWEASTWFVPGMPHTDLGSYLGLRGVLTIVTFAPAALLTWLGSAGLSGFAVLLQNSILIGWTAGFLLPKAVAPWRSIGAPSRWVAGGLCWLALAGFAPYPLVDLYAAIAALAAVVLLASRKPIALAGVGALLAYAINIRPAYIPVAIVLVLVTLVTHRWRIVWTIPGALLALTPQIIYNWIAHGALALAPIGTDGLAGLQAGFASYIVRYDTVTGGGNPRQFFCSPQMAGAIGGNPPSSTGQLLSTFIGNLPNSALFAGEKVAAAIHWPLSTPYLNPNSGVDAFFSAAMTLIVIAGCAFLLVAPFLKRANVTSGLWGASARVLAVVAATIVTIVGSATEARFALPLVLFGLVGTVGIADVGITTAIRRHKVLAAALALVFILTLGLAYLGLAHPAPPGYVSPTLCAGQ